MCAQVYCVLLRCTLCDLDTVVVAVTLRLRYRFCHRVFSREIPLYIQVDGYLWFGLQSRVFSTPKDSWRQYPSPHFPEKGTEKKPDKLVVDPDSTSLGQEKKKKGKKNHRKIGRAHV